MNFFAVLHRSIVEPSFYREAIAFPRGSIILFLFKVIVLSSILSAGADLWHLINGKEGIPRMVETAFPGMAIRNGVLHTATERPYIPPSYLIAPILNKLLGLPKIFNSEADSLVVVDTASDLRVPLKIPSIVLRAHNVTVVLPGNKVMEFPYENLFLGEGNLEFTAESIERFLKRYIGAVFFGYCISAFIYYGVLFFFCIFFLAVAAFIFSFDHKRTLEEYLKIASFAVSPIAIGSILESIAGVKTGWMLHFLIILSTIAMFRAIVKLNSRSRNIGEQ